MEKSYERINWENEPSILTPLNAVNLNKMDYSLNEIDDRVISLDSSKAKQSDLLLSVKGITYNQNTGIFVFTWQNGSTLEVDLNIEKIPVSFSMSESGIITMITTDGTEYTCDVAELIKAYLFDDSDQIAFTVTTSEDGSYHVTGTIKSGSITEEMLESGMLGRINSAKGYAEEALNKATEAASSAVMAESYAKGGTGTREGEDADNAKYYAEKAKAIANIDIATTEKAGIVKPDGTSVTVDPDGTIHAQTGTNIEALSDIGDVNIQNPQDKQALVYDSATKKWKNGQGSVSSAISDAWNASTTYAVGQYCIYNNLLWKCLVQHNGQTPTEGTYWTKVSVGNEIASVNSSLSVVGFSNETQTKMVSNVSIAFRIGNYVICLISGETSNAQTAPCGVFMNNLPAPSENKDFKASNGGYVQIRPDGGLRNYVPSGTIGVFTCVAMWEISN